MAELIEPDHQDIINALAEENNNLRNEKVLVMARAQKLHRDTNAAHAAALAEKDAEIAALKSELESYRTPAQPPLPNSPDEAPDGGTA